MDSVTVELFPISSRDSQVLLIPDYLYLKGTQWAAVMPGVSRGLGVMTDTIRGKGHSRGWLVSPEW